MSPELAYLKGVCRGDGSLCLFGSGYWRIWLGAIDKEFVQEFRRCVRAVKGVYVPKIYVYPPGAPSNRYSRKTKYVFACGWKRWPETFAEEGEVTVEFRRAWLRGLYDSEGSVGVKMISFSNTDLDLLREVQRALTQEGVRSGRPVLIGRRGRVTWWNGLRFVARKDCYQIHISSQGNLTRFRDRIGFTIYRKQQKLKEMLSTYKRPYAPSGGANA